MRLSEISSTYKFVVTSQSDFTRGFRVVLHVNGFPVGRYSYVIDDEGLSRHDVEVAADQRNKKYGIALTLKAMQVANDYDLGYEQDSLGQTADMDRVYASLFKNGLITGALGKFSLTGKGEDYLESLTT